MTILDRRSSARGSRGRRGRTATPPSIAKSSIAKSASRATPEPRAASASIATLLSFAALPLTALLPGAPGLHLPAAAQPSATAAADSISSPWLDETARRLILGARAARDTALLAIDGYTAKLSERTWVEMPFGRRTSSFLEGEYASRVRWSRGEPTIVRQLGSRARSPFLPTERADTIWTPQAGRYAADPMRDPFDFAFLAVANGRPPPYKVIRSPLEEDSERFYRFRSGDTLTISLPGGERVQAVQVTAIPRVRSVRLTPAILWIEPESFGLARVAYRIAKRIDDEFSFSFFDREGRFAPGMRIDLPTLEGEEEAGADSTAATESDDPPDTPGERLSSIFADLFSGLVIYLSPPMAMDLRAVVVDYQLRDLRYWLPRAARWEGTVGPAEDVYPDGRPTTPFPFRMDWAFEIEEIHEAGDAGAPTAAEVLEDWRQIGDRVQGELEDAGPDDVVALMPRSRSALLTSEDLPPPMREGGIGAPDPATADALADELAGIAPAGGETGDAAALESNPWSFDPPYSSLYLMRFNDVEGISVGSRVARSFGRTRANLTVRAGLDSREAPDAILTLSRAFGRARVVGNVYRTLEIPQEGLVVRGRPLEDYNWSHGVALRILPGEGRRDWVSLEGFARRETELEGDSRFDRFGAELDLRPWWGGSRDEAGAGFNVRARAVRGDNPHEKASATVATVLPVGAGLSLGLEAGAAGLWGEPRRRDLWQLGGTGRWLRGHEGVAPELAGHGGVLRAETVWRGRAGVQWRVPQFGPLRYLGPLGFRLSTFADWARAWEVDHAAWGIGLAASDGLLRLDLARGIELDTPGLTLPKWRVHLTGGRYF